MSADAGASSRGLHAQPRLGISAHVLQGRELQILRMQAELPALILVDRGTKSVRNERGTAVRAQPGDAIVLAGGQMLDFTNAVDGGGQYEARWLVFDTTLLDDPYYLQRAAHVPPSSLWVLPRIRPGIANAFQAARQSLRPASGIPESVARQRMLEVMHWLLEEGIALARPPRTTSLSARIRALVGARPDDSWTAARIAGTLAVSEATLRRRLAAEQTSLTDLLADTRMATALTLLQATTQPVSAIALSVGYESPSRFAIRFRERFGFAPSAVRGHDRIDPLSNRTTE
ncbi:AraC-like DNA-binding protein [Pseudoduganella lurida]|uniref:AraC-like DNA-binding protein n=1 Tax=Pseudoduganella lurida TaxID=1036180 RepID=A0A562QVL1_9BURK|nr:AraC family transcriptional regulator [Pseudoduganella lurida]TWI60280.1 AraC-like DNA-binding protein [Pseudoduganella lurida]